MNSAKGFVIGAGSLSFAGNWKKNGGFPPNGYGVIAATIALVFLVSFTESTPLERPTKYLAGLMLLAAAIRYVPGLATNKKKVNHG